MRVLNIAHRGAAAEAPENTLASFDLALRRGADGIELDVHLSSDGVPVVIHDARLERTTSGSGPVSAMPLSVLRRLDAGSWFNRRFRARSNLQYAGLRIPTLAEVLKFVRRRNCLVFVEIKQDYHRYPAIEEKVLQEIGGAGVSSLATVISFNLPTLARVRQLDSSIALGLDFSGPLHAFRNASSVSAATLLPHWALATRRFVRRAHRAGFQVAVWDVNPRVLMLRKIWDEVDGIITSHPGRLAEVIKKSPQISQIPQK